MILLPTTLCMAAAAALINFWLAMRCGRIRTTEKINIGTGGSDLMERRMRAQLNFVENTPWVLALIGLIELAGKGASWLAIVGAIYMLGRVAHALGMDGTTFKAGRGIGTATTMLSLLGLSIVGLLIATHYM